MTSEEDPNESEDEPNVPSLSAKDEVATQPSRTNNAGKALSAWAQKQVKTGFTKVEEQDFSLPFDHDKPKNMMRI